MEIVWTLKPYDELTVDELYEILKLRTDVFVVEQNCAYREIDGKDKHACHLFAQRNGELVAYLRILPKGVSFAEAALGRIVIHPGYRGQGYSKMLIERGIRFVTEILGESEIRISAQARLCEFYRSFGFLPSSEMYLEDGIPHMEMLLSVK